MGTNNLRKSSKSGTITLVNNSQNLCSFYSSYVLRNLQTLLWNSYRVISSVNSLFATKPEHLELHKTFLIGQSECLDPFHHVTLPPSIVSIQSCVLKR